MSIPPRKPVWGRSNLKRKLSRWLQWLHPVKEHPKTSLLVLFIVLFFLFRILPDLRRSVVVIESVTVPRTLERAGYSSAALTAAVQHAVQIMDEAFQDAGGSRSRSRASSSFRGSDDKGTELDIEIPGFKLSTTQLTALIRDVFGQKPRHAAASVTNGGGRLSYVLRISDPMTPATEPIEGIAPSVQELASRIGEQIMAAIKPGKVGNYLYYVRHREDDARRVLQECLRKGAPDQKCDCYVVLGDIANDESHFVLAEEDYYQAISWNPESVDARIGLGGLRDLIGEIGLAQKLYNLAHWFDPRSAGTHHNLASLAFNWGDLVTARREAEIAARLSRSDPSHQTLLADILHASGKDEQALRAVQGAIALDSSSAAPYKAWARILMDEGHFEDAETKWRSAIALDAADAFAYNDWGLALSNHELYSQAVDKFHKSIALRPRSVVFHNNLANALVALGRFPDAYEEFDRAWNLDHAYVFVLSDRARALSSEGRFQEADNVWKEASKLSPQNAYNLLQWANGLADRHDWEAALCKIREALVVYPNSSYIYQREGGTLSDLNRYSKASASYLNAVFYGRMPALFAGWAQMLVNDGRYGDAEKIRQGPLHADRLWPDVLIDQASSLHVQGDDTRALAVYRKAAEILPHSGRVHQWFANMLSDLNRYTEAGLEYQIALQVDPGRVSALADWAAMLYSSGDTATGTRKFQEAHALYPHSPYVYLQWANAKSNRKEILNCLSYYAKAVAMNPADPVSHRQYAKALSDAALYSDAEREFHSAVTKNDTYSEAYADWGSTLVAEKDVIEADTRMAEGEKNALADKKMAEAEKKWRKALEIAPRSGYAHIQWGAALSENGDLNAALTHIRLATQLSPLDSYYHLRLAFLYAKLKRNRDADAEFDKAVKLNRGNVYAIADWCTNLASNGMRDQALTKFNQARAVYHQNTYLLWQWALAERAAHPGIAIALLREAIVLNDDDPYLHFDLGSLLTDSKVFLQADIEFRRVLQLHPKYLWLAPRYAKMLARWGSSLGDDSNWLDAEAKYNRSEELDPSNVELYKLWGKTLFSKKDYDEAAKKYAHALLLEPGDQKIEESLSAAQKEAATAKPK